MCSLQQNLFIYVSLPIPKRAPAQWDRVKTGKIEPAALAAGL